MAGNIYDIWRGSGEEQRQKWQQLCGLQLRVNMAAKPTTLGHHPHSCQMLDRCLKVDTNKGRVNRPYIWRPRIETLTILHSQNHQLCCCFSEMGKKPDLGPIIMPSSTHEVCPCVTCHLAVARCAPNEYHCSSSNDKYLQLGRRECMHIVAGGKQ